MKKLIAFTAPILPGKTETWNSFVNELNGTYSKEFTNSRKELKIWERTFLQTTPHGDFVIVTLEGENPTEALANFANSDTKFSEWFVNKVQEIHGFDMKETWTAPEMIIDSEEPVKAKFAPVN